MAESGADDRHSKLTFEAQECVIEITLCVRMAKAGELRASDALGILAHIRERLADVEKDPAFTDGLRECCATVLESLDRATAFLAARAAQEAKEAPSPARSPRTSGSATPEVEAAPTTSPRLPKSPRLSALVNKLHLPERKAAARASLGKVRAALKEAVDKAKGRYEDSLKELHKLLDGSAGGDGMVSMDPATPEVQVQPETHVEVVVQPVRVEERPPVDEIGPIPDEADWEQPPKAPPLIVYSTPEAPTASGESGHPPTADSGQSSL